MLDGEECDLVVELNEAFNDNPAFAWGDLSWALPADMVSPSPLRRLWPMPDEPGMGLTTHGNPTCPMFDQ